MNSYYDSFNYYLLNTYLDTYPHQIKEKIKYILNDGKRLRPILFMIFSGISTSPNNDIIYKAAAAIETIHCLSLVIDDLPSMDNDMTRRDMQSFHAKYGQEYTNYIIYYLFNKLPLLFDDVLDINIDIENSNIENSNKDNSNMEKTITNLDMIHNMREIIEYNLNMLIDGQYFDMEWCTVFDKSQNIYSSEFNEEKYIIAHLLDISLNKDSKLNNNIQYLDITITKLMKNLELNMKKTSSLFNMSISLGFLTQLWLKNIDYVQVKGYIETCKRIMVWANLVGYMFQLSDDVLDIEPDLATGKPNICSIINYDHGCCLLKNGCNWLKIELILIQSKIKKNNEDYAKQGGTSNYDLDYEVLNEIINKIEARIPAIPTASAPPARPHQQDHV